MFQGKKSSKSLTQKYCLCIIYEVNEMQIKVASLDQIGSAISFDQVVAVSRFSQILSVGRDHSPVRVEGTVTKTKSGFMITVKAAMSLTLTCTRCLSPFRYEIETDYADEFVPIEPKKGESDDPFEDVLSVYQGEKIDITALVSELVLVAIPMKIICKQDCQGLCPQCGQNLNERSCSCIIDRPDPRLAKLADLLKKQ